jgi:tetratricopeptide (TPR) repeat protein
MFTRKYLTLVLTIVVFALAGVAACAQTAPVRGVVKMQKADGTQVPVPDAVVDAYRVDVGKGIMPSAKTNKKGEFSFVGFQLGQTYALAVSAPGIGPRVEPSVKAGREDITIIVTEGDGRKLTEAETREVAAAAASAPAGGKLTEAQRKEQEELAKKNEEIKAKNTRIQADDETARKASQEGIAALNAKNYDLAITKFDEGVAAVPDFVGSTPVLLNGKLSALRLRGYETYRQGAGTTDLAIRKPKYEAANKDFDSALAAYEQAMAIIKAAPAAANAQEQKGREALTISLLANAMETHRLKIVSGMDTSKMDQAAAVVEAYIAAEPDAAKKASARQTLGDMYRAAGDFEKAIASYRSVLESAPDNMDATAGLGLSLFAQGASTDPQNKEMLQEGLNYLQKFADTAPDTHPLKASVKETVEYLKSEQKLKAQPTKATATKKKNG